MGILDFLKKKEMNKIPPSMFPSSSPPIYDYCRPSPKENALEKFQKTNDLKEMGQILAENGVISVPEDKHHNALGQSLEHLDENGELPFGWIYHNKEFVNKIENEFRYFLNTWINTRGKGALEESTALKSLVVYIKDAEKLCKSKGECFSKWFSDCVADQKYIAARESDLRRIQKSL